MIIQQIDDKNAHRMGEDATSRKHFARTTYAIIGGIILLNFLWWIITCLIH